MFYFFDISSNNLCYRSVTCLAYVILADGYLVTSLLNYFTGVWKTRDNSANAAMKFKILTFFAYAFVEFLNQSVAAGWWWNTIKNYHFDCWFLIDMVKFTQLSLFKYVVTLYIAFLSLKHYLTEYNLNLYVAYHLSSCIFFTWMKTFRS